MIIKHDMFKAPNHFI